MPFKDGTGPVGDGPGSGRGRGSCAGRQGVRGPGSGAGRQSRFRGGRGSGAQQQNSKSALEQEAGILEIRLDKIRRQLAGLGDEEKAEPKV